MLRKLKGSDKMYAVALLKKFAESKGIETKEVDKFLSDMSEPKTLDELSEMPTDMLNHIGSISWVEEPLKSYIKDEMYWERHMTITLDDIINSLEDDRYNAEEDGKPELLVELDKIEKFVIESKFGSVVFDW